MAMEVLDQVLHQPNEEYYDIDEMIMVYNSVNFFLNSVERGKYVYSRHPECRSKDFEHKRDQIFNLIGYQIRLEIKTLSTTICNYWSSNYKEFQRRYLSDGEPKVTFDYLQTRFGLDIPAYERLIHAE